jgi:hypothetical protein
LRPPNGQNKFDEGAHEVEARRDCVYVLNDEEKAAIDAARRGSFASDEDVAVFWKRLGLA